MKKFLYFTSFILISLFTTIIIYLSTTGLETSKFNNLIIKEIHKKEPKIELELRKITIKLDLKKIQLFFSTSNPMVTYQDINIPIRDIKIYVKINKILSSKIEATKVAFTIEKFKIDEIQKIAIRIKPSNFKTYLLNNLEGGEIEKVFLDLSVDKNFKLTDYKVNGTIKKVNTQITKDFELKKVSFNFKTDNNITLINSINASYEGISITNGSINLQRNKIIEINGKFNTQFKLNTKNIKKLFANYKFKKTKIEKSKCKMIFILGMPRSGTTLVEQIISSHPDVYGSGELNFLARVVYKNFFKADKINFIDNFAELNNADLSLISNQYFDFIKNFASDKNYITDKALFNFQWIGFIKILFPEAKIINCTRNPKDNCLSIYKNLFENEGHWCYNKKELIECYNLYTDLMLFWNKKMPGEIYEIKYEDLIASPESKIKELILATGLDWNEKCLKYNENKNAIKTLSVNQARKKIYSSSVSLHEKYKPFLKEFSEYFG